MAVAIETHLMHAMMGRRSPGRDRATDGAGEASARTPSEASAPHAERSEALHGRAKRAPRTRGEAEPALLHEASRHEQHGDKGDGDERAALTEHHVSPG